MVELADRSTRNGSRIRLYVLWLLVCGIVAAAGLEGGLRLYHAIFRPNEPLYLIPRVILRPSRIPNLYSELNPSRHPARKIFINDQGFRADPLPVRKPEGEIRVFVAGDSVPFGMELPQEQTLSYRLEDRIREATHSDWVRVINAGVPNYNAQQILINLDERIARFSPDICVVFFNYNDFRPHALTKFRARLNRFLYNHVLVYHTLVASYLIRQNPEYSEKDFAEAHAANREAIETICRRAEEDPERWLIVIHPVLSEKSREEADPFYQEFAQILAEQRAPALWLEIPFRQRFGTLDSLSVENLGYPLHMTPEATDAAAGFIFDALEQRIRVLTK